MKCRKVRKNLSAYADGELRSRLRQKVKTHLAVCEKCSAELSSLEEIASTTRSTLRKMVSAKMPPQDLRRTIMQAAEPRRMRRQLLISLERLAASGAAIAVVSGFLVGFTLERRFNSQREAFRGRIAEQSIALRAAKRDSEMARSRIVKAETRLGRMEARLRMALAARGVSDEAVEEWPARRHGLVHPVVLSLDIPGAEALLENGLF